MKYNFTRKLMFSFILIRWEPIYNRTKSLSIIEDVYERLIILKTFLWTIMLIIVTFTIIERFNLK